MLKKMNQFLATIVAAICAVLLASCQTDQLGRLFSIEHPDSKIEWNQEELSRDVAMRTVRTTKEASFHIIRLQGLEKPHIHDEHDSAVFVLTGRARVSVGDTLFKVRAGDIIEIPRGTVHWAKNLDPEASIVYAVFTPPYDGADRRDV